MALFDLKISENRPEPTKKMFENNLEAKSAARLASFEQLQTAKVKIIRDHIPVPPRKGECIFVYTTNQFNTMAFIVWIIQTLGRIRSLTISTYSIGATAINTLIKWYDSGQIEEIYFYCATYAKRISPKNVDLLMAQAAARERVTVSFGFNHSKILLAQTGTEHIMISGSRNFSENAYNEQYTICNDESIYKFYHDCIREDSPESRGQGEPPAAGQTEVV